MKIGYGILLACFFVALNAGATEKYRIFTDTQGRSLEAQIVSYDEAHNKVTVKPKGRSAMTVPVNIFSAEDQAYIVEWSENQAFLNERKLKVGFSRTKKKNADKSGEGWDMASKTYDTYYTIELENGSKIDLKDITLEYVVFYKQDHWSGSRRTEKTTKEGTLYKKSTISLPMKSKKEVESETIGLVSYREAGWGGSTWADLDGDIDGIMVKLSMKTKSGETITREVSYPDRLSARWTTETKNVELTIHVTSSY